MEKPPAKGAPLDVIASALRRARERTGLSLSEVAKRANIAKSTLSQLEAGTGNPSIETLWALGMTLEVPFGQLIEPPQPKVQIIRAGESPTVRSEHANYVTTLLAASAPNVRQDLYLVTAEPGPPRRSEPHMPGVVERVVLCSGRARLGPSDDPAELGPGDYMAYPADQPHVFEALEPGTMCAFLCEHS